MPGGMTIPAKYSHCSGCARPTNRSRARFTTLVRVGWRTTGHSTSRPTGRTTTSSTRTRSKSWSRPWTAPRTDRRSEAQAQVAGNDEALDLVGALADLEDLGVAPVPGDRVLVHEAVPAEHLGGVPRAG